MKLIITEQQLKFIIIEHIHPMDVDDDYKSVLSICEGKRGVAFIVIDYLSDKKYEKIINLVNKCNLNSVSVPKNPYGAYVVFKDGFEKDAHELRKIAIKYDGFLSPNADENETRRIGELLNYDPEEVERFIKNGNKI